MPYYEYECADCGERFEALQTIAEHEQRQQHDSQQPLACPKCGSRRVEAMLPSSVYVITSKKS